MSDHLPEVQTVQLPASLAALVAQAEALAGAAYADNTRQAYRTGWARFETWCQQHRVCPLPASPALVVLFATELAQERRPGTIALYLTAISAMHRSRGYDSPVRTGPVRLVMRGIRRTLGMRPQGKDALRLDDLRRMLRPLPDTAMGDRDRALLTLGWWGAFRRSELVSLLVEDIDDQPSGLICFVPFSKRDQERRGRSVGIPLADREVCAVRAVRAWLARLRAETGSGGSLFPSIDRWDRIGPGATPPRTVARVVKLRCDLADPYLDSTRYSAHSLRIGFCTEAALAGESERQIAKQTGHATDEGVRTYTRDVDPIGDSAAAGLANGPI